MKQRQSLHVLCAVAIFLAQLFAVVHTTQHELTAEKSGHCELCAVAHAAPVPPAAPALYCDVSFDSLPVAQAADGLNDRRPFARPNTRGPPSFLA
jgi:hypothetical protein